MNVQMKTKRVCPSISDIFLEFSIKKIVLQILDLQTGLSEHDIMKELQRDFPEMRGWIKGRLERFRKFIRFGDGICPHYFDVVHRVFALIVFLCVVIR